MAPVWLRLYFSYVNEPGQLLCRMMRKRKFARGEQPTDLSCVNLEDFDDPFDAFYWFGYYGGLKSTKHAPTEQSSKPLCEIAHFCVFDTETSGLSRNDCAVQTAIGFFDEDGRKLGFYDRFWKLPKGVKISQGSYAIHKISTIRINKEGCEAAPELRKVMKIMKRMLARGKRIVAHNAAFDCRILAQTARSHGVNEWNLCTEDVFCTMRHAKPFCNLVSNATGKPKAPSNAELYKFLTGSSPVGALHNALVDIKVTAKSYVEGRKRNWW